MLKRIDLRHFKCFADLKLPLCPLTLLSGANASGKSSVLQALVLLHQTMREQEWSTRLLLNGETAQFGAAADVIDQVHGGGCCAIGLLDGDTEYCWEFEGKDEDRSLTARRLSVNGGADENLHSLVGLLPLEHHSGSLTDSLYGLVYLTAERLGPRESYPLETLAPVVGPRGEHTVNVLYSGRNAPVLEGLAIADVRRGTGCGRSRRGCPGSFRAANWS